MAKLHRLDSNHLLFLCPACKCPHYVRVAGYAPMWEWNGDEQQPTFIPDLTFNGFGPGLRCHFRVEDGMIEYFDDSEHTMHGLTVELPEWALKALPEPECV